MSNDLVRMGGIVGVVLIVAITALTIFHPGDNTATITALVAAAMGLLSFLSSRSNTAKLEDNTAKTEANTDHIRSIHLDINSRLDQLVTAEKKVSRAEGSAEGAAEERGREK